MNKLLNIRRSLPRGLVLVLALGILAAGATTALAATNYTLRRVANPVNAPVQGNEQLRTNYAVSLLVRTTWRTRRISRTAFGFGLGSRSCRYSGTVTTHVEQGFQGDALVRVRSALPVSNQNLVLDEGTRGRAAWRVIRVQRGDGRVEVRGQFQRTLTTQSGTVPPGQTAWLVVDARALSRIGSECHSGTYRQTLGPQLGDAFAGSRTRGFVFRPRGG
jgi:hypothetical protein